MDVNRLCLIRPKAGEILSQEVVDNCTTQSLPQMLNECAITAPVWRRNFTDISALTVSSRNP